MAIQKVKMGQTKISPGQWVCETPILRDHICSRPAQVVRVSDTGMRVYFADRYCARHTILFVCDTKEEADHLYSVSTNQFESLRAVREKYDALIQSSITS